MFIKLHLVSGKSPVSLNLDHIVKFTSAAAADGGGAVVHLDQDYDTVYVSESYEDVNRTIAELFRECRASKNG